MTLHNFIRDVAQKANIPNEVVEEQIKNLNNIDLTEDFNAAQKLLSLDAAKSSQDIAQFFNQKYNQDLTRAQTAKLQASGFSDDDISIINQLDVTERTSKIIEIQKNKLESQLGFSADERVKTLENQIKDWQSKAETYQRALDEERKKAQNEISKYQQTQNIMSFISSLPVRKDIFSADELQKSIYEKAQIEAARLNGQIVYRNGKMEVVSTEDGMTKIYDEFFNPVSAEKMIRDVAQNNNLLKIEEPAGNTGGNPNNRRNMKTETNITNTNQFQARVNMKKQRAYDEMMSFYQNK